MRQYGNQREKNFEGAKLIYPESLNFNILTQQQNMNSWFIGPAALLKSSDNKNGRNYC